MRKTVHEKGLRTSLEFMGENVTTIAEADGATYEFLRLIKALQIENKADRSVNPETGEKILTTWGKIHYAKDGTHIVPTLPRK